MSTERHGPSRALTAMGWAAAALVVGAVAFGIYNDMNSDQVEDGEAAVAAVGSTIATSASVTIATTTTTRFAPVLGWVVGGCVDFVGQDSRPVSCDGPYDASVIDVVASHADCHPRMQWFVEMELGVACLVENVGEGGLPEFPPGLDDLVQGRSTWVVVLAAAEDTDDPVLAEAIGAAGIGGYLTDWTDCDAGAAEAIGLPETYYTVSVYLASEADARAAQDAFAARSIDGTVALVQTYCLD